MLSEIASENGHFNFEDVANQVNLKMIRRHPHVFGNTKVNSVDDVWKNWEKIKKSEKSNQYSLDNIPKLPALMRAEKIQKTAARTGFDWPNINGATEKLKEECSEFINATNHKNIDSMEDEAGDVLFSIVNCFRKLGIDPEKALERSNKKFINRFTEMEKRNPNFSDLDLSEKKPYGIKLKLK